MLCHHVITDIADCSQFRQTIAARPPRIIHGCAMILSLLLLCALGWAAWTRVNLVVLAKGRVRPMAIPTHIYTPSGSEFAGRVVFAPFDEGDAVNRGDVLMRLDTSRIDNLIAKLNRTIEGCELELTNLKAQRELLESQTLAAQQKAQVELQMAEETFAQARLKRESEIRNSQADQQIAEEQVKRLKKLLQSRAVSQQEVDEGENKLLSAKEKLVRARLPADGAAVSVARQSLELVSRELALRKAELESKIVVKQSEKATIDKDLANLQMQRNEAVLLAPFDGIIVSGRVRVGDMLEAGKPVYQIAEKQNSCFEAIVPANDVGHITIGLPVRIRFDAYDYQQYGTLKGKVLFLSPDSRPINTSEPTSATALALDKPAGFTIRVQLDSDEIGPPAIQAPIKLGLTGTAEIITENESLLYVLLKHIRRTISFA